MVKSFLTQKTQCIFHKLREEISDETNALSVKSVLETQRIIELVG